MSGNIEEDVDGCSRAPVKKNPSGAGELSQNIVPSPNNILQTRLQTPAVWHEKQNQEREDLSKVHLDKLCSRDEEDGQKDVFSRSYHTSSESSNITQYVGYYPLPISAGSIEAEGISSEGTSKVLHPPVLNSSLRLLLPRNIEQDWWPLDWLRAVEDDTALEPATEAASRDILVSPGKRTCYEKAMQDSVLMHHPQNQEQESSNRNDNLIGSPQQQSPYVDAFVMQPPPQECLQSPVSFKDSKSLMIDNVLANRDPLDTDARGSTSARSLEGEGASSVTRNLLICKILTKTDVQADITGILLPQKQTIEHFGTLKSDGGSLEITMHDDVKGVSWAMELTVCPHSHGNVYKLKKTLKYTKAHSLQVGDLLQIYLEEPSHRYILKAEKGLPKFIPPSVEHSPTNPDWKLIIRKELTKTDITVGPKSKGYICLGSKEVEENFPNLDKEGLPIDMYDWDADNKIWAMTLKAVSHTRGRMYRLTDTGEYSKLHSLKQGNWVHIYKCVLLPERAGEEPNAKYSLKASLLPLS